MFDTLFYCYCHINVTIADVVINRLYLNTTLDFRKQNDDDAGNMQYYFRCVGVKIYINFSFDEIVLRKKNFKFLFERIFHE